MSNDLEIAKEAVDDDDIKSKDLEENTSEIDNKINEGISF